MWKAISLEKIDELHKEFHSLHLEGETFSKFIERTSDNEIPVWDWTDSVGVVTPKDFEDKFDKKFIEDNFEELAELWYKGLNAQVDYSILLECVKDEFEEKNKN